MFRHTLPPTGRIRSGSTGSRSCRSTAPGSGCQSRGRRRVAGPGREARAQRGRRRALTTAPPMHRAAASASDARPVQLHEGAAERAPLLARVDGQLAAERRIHPQQRAVQPVGDHVLRHERGADSGRGTGAPRSRPARSVRGGDAACSRPTRRRSRSGRAARCRPRTSPSRGPSAPRGGSCGARRAGPRARAPQGTPPSPAGAPARSSRSAADRCPGRPRRPRTESSASER